LLESGWGGAASYYCFNDGAGWSGEKAADLTFSMQ